MQVGDALGWAACLMTLVTFVQQRMLPLRLAAILANVFFIGYAGVGHYLPILALHGTLLPINFQRLLKLISNRPKGHSSLAPPATSYKSGGEEETSSEIVTGLSGLL